MRRVGQVWGAVAVVVTMAGGVGCDREGTGVTGPSSAGAVASEPAAPPPPTTPPPTGPPMGAPPPVQRIIWGRVLDFDSDAPIGGARVALWHFDGVDRELTAVTTTGDGRFNLTAVTWPAFWVRIERLGHKTATYRGQQFDFTGDVALRVYRQLTLRPGEPVELKVFAEQGYDSCGPEGWLWCREVAVAAGGRPIVVESTADDDITLAEDPHFQEWDRDYGTRATLVVSGDAVWVIRRMVTYQSPPVRVRLTARQP